MVPHMSMPNAVPIIQNDMAENARYFIAKVQNLPSLKTCVQTSQWACRDRKFPPHPREILSDALETEQKTFVIFSVNNCHGWHGYAEILDKPCPRPETVENVQMNSCEHNDQGNYQDQTSLTSAVTPSDVSQPSGSQWYYFNIKWRKFFITEFGERCLSSSNTENLLLSDNTPVNKARNWQELPEDAGKKICHLIEEYYEELSSARLEKIKAQEAKIPPAFFQSSDNVDMIEENWTTISQKIKGELGTIILACPFGSQRYNLHNETSDMDMFIVYQADTCDVLGLNPPKQTIKSSEREGCDYTIHEALRYSELLLSGDHRCVETLFMDEKSIIHDSEAMTRLRDKRHLFLNKSCLEKYLRDACGSKGTKQLKRWTEEQTGCDIMSPKMCKLAYVVIRLLQNACDIVKGRQLAVYRRDRSPERDLLMRIRNGHVSVPETWNQINSLLRSIEEQRESVPSTTQELRNTMEQWLLELRYTNFQKTPSKHRSCDQEK